MKSTILLFTICVMVSFVCYAQHHYYWADGRKNTLEPDSTIVVLMNHQASEGRAITALQYDKVERYDDCAIFRNITKQHRVKLKDEKLEFATAFRINTVPLIVTNVVTFRPKAAIAEIERVFRQRIRFRDRTASGVYHYIVHNFRETLAVANALAESGLVEWCQPDFVIEIKPTTVDPFYSQQYYLNNTGQTGGVSDIDINAPEAWAISTGCTPVRVAVLDYGVEPHEDIGNRYLTGFTALDPSGTGLPSSSEVHGQQCAGIIAATHDNNIGIAGVAPTSHIIPINGFIGINNVSRVADAIDAGWRPTRGGADILSNSWNWAIAPSLAEITQAINDARTQGRGGKGAIVVFSAGNQGGAIEFPANVEGVVTVGAIN
jgi:serine protease